MLRSALTFSQKSLSGFLTRNGVSAAITFVGGEWLLGRGTGRGGDLAMVYTQYTKHAEAFPAPPACPTEQLAPFSCAFFPGGVSTSVNIRSKAKRKDC